jgi:hypothetical protein
MTHTIYGIKRDGEIVYIGATSRAIETRLVEHRSRGMALPGDYIFPICTRPCRESAERAEIHMIALIGLHRLSNSGYKPLRDCRIKSHGEAARKRISEFHKGKKWCLGQKWDDARRERQSSAMRGIKKNPDLVYANLGEKNGWFSVHLNGEYVGTFSSQMAAARACKMPKSTFVNVFTGKTKNAKGLVIKHVP